MVSRMPAFSLHIHLPFYIWSTNLSGNRVLVMLCNGANIGHHLPLDSLEDPQFMITGSDNVGQRGSPGAAASCSAEFQTVATVCLLSHSSRLCCHHSSPVLPSRPVSWSSQSGSTLQAAIIQFGKRFGKILLF